MAENNDDRSTTTPPAAVGNAAENIPINPPAAALGNDGWQPDDLTSPEKKLVLYQHVKCRKGDPVPPNAVKGGQDDGPYYFGRGNIDRYGLRMPGSVGVSPHNVKILEKIAIPHRWRSYENDDFDVLTSSVDMVFIPKRTGDPIPDGAIEGGWYHTSQFYARVKVEGVHMPGKVPEQENNLKLLGKALVSYDGDDHKFTEFEVLTVGRSILRVEFDLNKWKKGSTAPKVIARQTLRNELDLNQNSTFSYSESVTLASSFTRSFGANISVGTSFKTGIPFLAEGGISLQVGASMNMVWGKNESVTKSYTGSFPVTVPANKEVIGTASITETKLTVPYKMYLANGAVSGGTWEGVSAFGVDIKYKEK